MKRIIALILAVLTAMLALAGCGNEQASKKTFTIGFDASFPPYGYKDGNDYVGFDIDLAKEVASRRGWEINLKPIDWDSKDFELNSGTIDCIWNGFTINGREDKYTWSDPYVDNSQVIVVKKGDGISALSDLAGKTVVVQTDSSAESLQRVPEYNTAFLNLESGAADAVAMDIGVAEYQIKSRGADKFEILSEKISSEKYGIGFKLGNTELRDQVQSTLDEMMKDGKFLETAKKWELENSVIIK